MNRSQVMDHIINVEMDKYRTGKNLVDSATLHWREIRIFDQMTFGVLERLEFVSAELVELSGNIKAIETLDQRRYVAGDEAGTAAEIDDAIAAAEIEELVEEFCNMLLILSCRIFSTCCSG